MFQADLWLIQQIAGRWKIPYDKDHIIGHYRIDSVNRRDCPGTGLPWDRLLHRAQGHQPVTPPVQPPVKRCSLRPQQQVAELQAKLASIGRLVQAANATQVYLLKNGTLYPLANQQTLERLYSHVAGGDRVAAGDIVSLPLASPSW